MKINPHLLVYWTIKIRKTITPYTMYEMYLPINKHPYFIRPLTKLTYTLWNNHWPHHSLRRDKIIKISPVTIWENSLTYNCIELQLQPRNIVAKAYVNCPNVNKYGLHTFVSHGNECIYMYKYKIWWPI